MSSPSAHSEGLGGILVDSHVGFEDVKVEGWREQAPRPCPAGAVGYQQPPTWERGVAQRAVMLMAAAGAASC